MYYYAHVRTATELFEKYTGDIPLHIFLKKYFKEHKKYGSKDRKQIADLLYGLYRLGAIETNYTTEEKIFISSFLNPKIKKEFFETCAFDFKNKYELHAEAKVAYLQDALKITIPQPYALSSSITNNIFLANLFSTPNLFVRIRKNKQRIIESLQKNNIPYTEYTNCICVAVHTKLQEILYNTDYAIQDYSSQQVANYFDVEDNQTWWDTCAASGGKSLLVLDTHKKINLLVTDSRASILQNLQTRLKEYGYTSYQKKVMDCSNMDEVHAISKMHRIICDVPCSGSGTWARTPEQHYFFNKEKLDHYTQLQYKIAHNCLQRLHTNGEMYYITCSVFKAENENIIEQLKANNSQIKSIEMQTIENFALGADAMFVAKIKT